MNLLVILGYILAIAYGGLLLTMTLRQRRILYQPECGPADKGALERCEVFPLRSEDGTALTGWYVPAREGFPTIIYYHGNAGNLGHRSEKFRIFSAAGFGVIAVHYRGYGESGGTPTEQGVISDARALLAHATGTRGLDAAKLILYGESLGSGVAVRMASERAVGGLVLEAPYSSVADRAQEIFRYLPVRRLLRDRFESLAHLPEVKAPLLILHGERDVIIPASHGRRMLEAANAPKRAVFYPDTGHTDFDFTVISRELLAFAREHGLYSGLNASS